MKQKLIIGMCILILLVGCNEIEETKDNGVVFEDLDNNVKDNILHLLISLKDEYKVYNNIIFTSEAVRDYYGGEYHNGVIKVFAKDNGSIITATTLCHEILHKKGFTHENMNKQDIQLVCFDFDKLNNICEVKNG